HDVIADPLVKEHAGLVAAATATVADRAVRHLGTFGGSLAHGDPAGDLPAVTLAYDARMVVTGPAGTRTVAAADFFQDYLHAADGTNPSSDLHAGGDYRRHLARVLTRRAVAAAARL